MTTATIYPTKLAAILANTEAAFNAGMNMETTAFMYLRVDHEDGRSALLDNLGGVTVEAMLADGWPVSGLMITIEE